MASTAAPRSTRLQVRTPCDALCVLYLERRKLVGGRLPVSVPHERTSTCEYTWLLMARSNLLLSHSALCAGKNDWYAQIRAYLGKEHPVFDYDFHKQRIEVRKVL